MKKNRASAFYCQYFDFWCKKIVLHRAIAHQKSHAQPNLMPQKIAQSHPLKKTNGPFLDVTRLVTLFLPTDRKQKRHNLRRLFLFMERKS